MTEGLIIGAAGAHTRGVIHGFSGGASGGGTGGGGGFTDGFVLEDGVTMLVLEDGSSFLQQET